MSDSGNNKEKIFREQLLTVEDLQLFKMELLVEMRSMLKGAGIQPFKQWLKSEEVRKMLDLSNGKLQTLRINGTLPYTKIGGVIYYDQDDIQEMLVSRKIRQK